MNKLEIIDHIAKSADISKAAAGRSLDAAVTAIKTAMKKGSMVTLVGFGTFYVGRRAARTGRNPQTGVEIKIKAARVPKFRPGKALKDAVNWQPLRGGPASCEGVGFPVKGCLAQLVERRPYKANVGGSIPSAPTIQPAGESTRGG